MWRRYVPSTVVCLIPTMSVILFVFSFMCCILPMACAGDWHCSYLQIYRRIDDLTPEGKQVNEAHKLRTTPLNSLLFRPCRGPWALMVLPSSHMRPSQSVRRKSWTMKRLLRTPRSFAKLACNQWLSLLVREDNSFASYSKTDVKFYEFSSFCNANSLSCLRSSAAGHWWYVLPRSGSP